MSLLCVALAVLGRLSRPGWLQTPAASASCVLGLKVYATTPSLNLIFLRQFSIISDHRHPSLTMGNLKP